MCDATYRLDIFGLKACLIASDKKFARLLVERYGRKDIISVGVVVCILYEFKQKMSRLSVKLIGKAVYPEVSKSEQ